MYQGCGYYEDEEPVPEIRCACGKKAYSQCKEVRVTTFSEKFACGYVVSYTNRNGYDDNLIEVNGKRIR